MDTGSLTYKTLKNVSYSFLNYSWMFVFSIFVTPIIVFRLGVETYGVYMLVLTVSNLLGLFDLGIGYILIKYIAEYTAIGEEKKLKNLMYSFNTILFGLGILGLIIMSTVGYWANVLFSGNDISREYYFIIFFLSGVISLVTALNTPFATTITALQRFDYNTKIGLASLTISNITILTLVLFGYGLKAIFLSQLIFAFIFLLIFRYYSKKILPLAELKFAWQWLEVKNAYKFGIATYMSNAANSALTYFDRLLIPIFYGPGALSYYTLPGNIAAKTPSVINSLSSVIFPMISGLNGLNDLEKIKNIYKRVFNLLTVITSAITISIALFAEKILYFWLSADFAEKSGTVLVILTFTYFFLSLGGVLNNFLLGLSKTKFLFKSSLFMATVNIVLLFILLPKYGIIGASWAYLISVLPVIFMFYYTEKKFLNLPNRSTEYLKLYSKIFITAILFFSLCKFSILPIVNSLKAVILLGPLSVLIYLLIYRVLGFYEKEDMLTINAFMLVVLKKFKLIK